MSSWPGVRNSNQRASQSVDICLGLGSLLYIEYCSTLQVLQYTWVWIRQISSAMALGKQVCRESESESQMSGKTYHVGVTSVEDLNTRGFHLQLAHQVLSRQNFEPVFSWSGVRQSNQRASWLVKIVLVSTGFSPGHMERKAVNYLAF